MTVIKMLAVFALLGLTLWWLRRADRSALLSARRGERPVAVLAQTRLGKTASVAVVRIGTAAYAVGVTEQSVTLLVPEPIELPEPTVDGDSSDDSDDGDGTDGTATARTATRPTTVTGLLRALLERVRRPVRQVQYLELDAQLPPGAVPTARRDDSAPINLTAAPAAPAPDGSAAPSSARTPETLRRR